MSPDPPSGSLPGLCCGVCLGGFGGTGVQFAWGFPQPPFLVSLPGLASELHSLLMMSFIFSCNIQTALIWFPFSCSALQEGRAEEAETGIWFPKFGSSAIPPRPSRWNLPSAGAGLSRICLGALWWMSSAALNARPGSGRVLRHPGAALPAHLQNRFGFAAAAAAAEMLVAAPSSVLALLRAWWAQEELQGWAGNAGSWEDGQEELGWQRCAQVRGGGAGAQTQQLGAP